ncbi:hypothetical protein C1I93_11270 [Micromonospora endophytica]|uniref:Uncharacterized protein n=2 Tax=Micromonospora endophytica TaxID=515350 RepID=A0A2W2DK94_9ACTN|nr:hypothetical protein C1I93_11270 [Micromonospora endophytica]RIW49531.1 hypothetical protein D3H59_04685 [Micromonospora endophytica]
MAWLRNPSGPRVAVRPVNADTVVARWRADRAGIPAAAPSAPVGTPPAAGRRGWFRFRRRRAA